MIELLKKGDKVALIAPARAVSKEEMLAFKSLIAGWGLQLFEGENLYLRENQYSGSDLQRFSDLKQAWEDPEIKAIFCARGGYGSMRFLSMAEKELDLSHAKWLVGFSDICSLQLYLFNQGIASIHGPMAFNMNATHPFKESNFDCLQQLLFSGSLQYDLVEMETLRPQPFEGILIGGNLSLLYASLGTPEQPDTRGCVLFIEDLDEYLYHIDRMMVSLKRAGLLKNLKALVVGEFGDMKDNTIPFGKSVKDIITDVTSDYNFPVIFDFPAGHGEKNYCFKQGCSCTFDGRYFKQH